MISARLILPAAALALLALAGCNPHPKFSNSGCAAYTGSRLCSQGDIEPSDMSSPAVHTTGHMAPGG